MKSLMLSLLILVPFMGQGQIIPIDPATHKVAYAEVTEVRGTSKEEVYDRARKWFAQQYAFAQDVVLSEHAEDGELRIQAELPLKVGLDASGVVRYKCTLSVKDGKYRYLITDFTFHYPGRPPYHFEDPRMHPQLKILFKTDEKLQLLLAGLHQKMIRNVTASRDDW